MADYRWEVPFLEFPGVVQLLHRATDAERRGDKQGLSALVDQIRGLPGYPKGVDPMYDRLVVVPKNARILSDWGKWRKGTLRKRPQDLLEFHNLTPKVN